MPLDNLPSSIKKIIFNTHSKYNLELNCLPKQIKQIQLPINYDKRILNIPKNLSVIICSRNYAFINDFDNYKVETYSD